MEKDNTTPNETTLEERCFFHAVSRKQLEADRKIGESIPYNAQAVQGYKERGCYECDGLNKECSHYLFYKKKQ
jgi:hypothetical protein